MNNKNYLDTIYPLDKTYKKGYNGSSSLRKNKSIFDNDPIAQAALDYLYSKTNRDKTKNFLANNGLPSFEDREYNKKYYGEQEESRRILDLFKEKTNGILNSNLPDDTDRAFLSGLLGKDEEENNYRKKLASSNRALGELQDVFRGSQFEGELNPTVQRLTSAPTITNTVNRNPNVKNEIQHAIADPNKKYSTTLYSANSKVTHPKESFSKEFNNHVFTSKNKSYTEKKHGIDGIFKTDFYYAEKDGKRYRANSLETVAGYDWNSIDENFLSGTFQKLINEANKKPTDIKRVLTQSVKGELNFKEQLDEKTLYLINGVVYNKNEAGNFTWAYFLESKKYSAYFSGALAQAGTLVLPFFTHKPKDNSGNLIDKIKEKFMGALEEARFDEEWDRRARWAGVRYFYEKNNMLWLYDLLYGDTIRY